MKWQWEDFGQYVEVMLLTDSKEHYAGDECWCNPVTTTEPDSRPLISHNAVTDLQPSDPDTNSEQAEAH
jgi:hypothetical protein